MGLENSKDKEFSKIESSVNGLLNSLGVHNRDTEAAIKEVANSFFKEKYLDAEVYSLQSGVLVITCSPTSKQFLSMDKDTLHHLINEKAPKEVSQIKIRLRR